MSSIGPQIPAHFLKQRQRTPPEDNDTDVQGGSSIGPQIPTHLLQSKRNDNNEENDETDAGPSIGPQIPSAFAVTNHSTTPPLQDQEEDDDDDDAYAPALPPKLVASRSSEPKPAKRVLGPNLPGQLHNQYGADDDDSEDEYGPGPLPPPAGVNQGGDDGVSEGVREFIEREERRKKDIEDSSKPKALQRDSWMLVPPSSSSALSALADPTKLKARQFNRSSASGSSREGPSNLWTETPAERQKRIADEVAGKKRRAVEGVPEVDEAEDRTKRRRDEVVRRAVEEHNRTSRGQSLLDLHASSQKSSKSKSDKDQEPPAFWDHGRDMSMGGRLMDEKQRSKMIQDARSLGDRFGSGRSGGYL